MTVPAALSERISDFEAFGIRAFTTTRTRGTFGSNTEEPARLVTERWTALRRELSPSGGRFATASQVHGSRVVVHDDGWEGWLRVHEADGHVSIARGTGMAVTIADCVPVFIAHPGGAIALLHSGWRGTVARIVAHGISVLETRGVVSHELRMHLGPSICGRCYEVSPEVYGQLAGRAVTKPTTIDLRAIIADQARSLGVRHIAISPACTRCDNDRFFSHRAGDDGRQLGVMIADP